MGKCCSKEEKEQQFQEEIQEVLLDIDPGGGETEEGGTITMTGGTLVVRSPERWQVTTTRDIPVTAVTTTTTKKVFVTSGAKNGTGTGKGKVVTKTFRFDGNSSGSKAVATSNGGLNGKGSVTKNAPSTNITKRSSGDGSPLLKQKPTSKIVTVGTKKDPKCAKSMFTVMTPSRMGKTVTETASRVYTKDGKRFQETVVTVTKEQDDGNITKTTKTTTKEIDAFDTKGMTAALEGGKSKNSTGGARKSSTSSSSGDSSPERKSTTKVKPGDKSSKGVIGKIKSKVTGKDSSSDGDSSDEEDFVEEVYKGVNACRKKHGVKELKLSKELTKYAKEWAKQLAANDKMSHRPDNKYGENVYCISSNSKTFKVNGQEVVDKWYSENKDHIYGEEPKGSLLKSGHFSQMVWKDTKEMGVGKARSASGTKIFVVANFDPQGNWMGQFATQVPPVGGFTKSAGEKKPLTSKLKVVRKSSSSSESSSDEEEFAKDCLKAHNEYRKKHGVQPLKLNQDICKYAQEWANTIAKRNVMQHRQPNKYGENIYWFGSSDMNYKIKGKEPVESWYSEIKDFVFGREPADLRAGHFTQVVWKDSKELGVGMARSSSGGIYIVANYDPPGNYVGSFSTKVPKLGASLKPASAEKPSPSKSKNATKPAKSSTSSSDSDEEDFLKECLKSHNNYRKKHGVPPLKLSKELNRFAQEWANNIASRNTLQHRQPNKYGENIYMSYNPSKEAKGNDPVDSWYSEIKDYTFGKEPSTLKAGHFTQVVWKDSKELGVGIAKAPTGAVYIVANYNPPGNYTGRYNSNVPRPVK